MQPGIYDPNKPSRSRGQRPLLAGILVSLLVVALLLIILGPGTTEAVSMGELAQLINEGRVESITENDGTLVITLNDDDSPQYEAKLSANVEDLPAYLETRGADAAQVQQIDLGYNNSNDSTVLPPVWPLLWIAFIALTLVGLGIFIGTRMNSSRSHRKTRKVA